MRRRPGRRRAHRPPGCARTAPATARSRRPSRSGQARCDPLHVGEHLPGLLHRHRNRELVDKLHGPNLKTSPDGAPRGAGIGDHGTAGTTPPAAVTREKRMRQQRAAPPAAASRRPWLAAAGVALIVVALGVTGLARRYVVAESVQFVVFAMVAPALIVLGAPWRLLCLSRPAGTEPGQPGAPPLDRLAAAR